MESSVINFVALIPLTPVYVGNYHNFDSQTTKEWKEALGKIFAVDDFAFCTWLRDEKRLISQQVKQQDNAEYLKKEYNNLWIDIHPGFTSHQDFWEREGFTYSDAQKWIEAGFDLFPLMRVGRIESHSSQLLSECK